MHRDIDALNLLSLSRQRAQQHAPTALTRPRCIAEHSLLSALTAFEALASGKPIVATDADGLLDILTPGHDALVVAKRDARAIVDGVVKLIETPGLATTLAQGARLTGAKYDIAVFVRKMEQLYEILHRTSRATGRAGVLQADLRFLRAKG